MSRDSHNDWHYSVGDPQDMIRARIRNEILRQSRIQQQMRRDFRIGITVFSVLAAILLAMAIRFLL